MRAYLIKAAARVSPAVFAALLVACTDLSAVREWSTTSMEAAQFNEVVATYADTPTRLSVYDADAAESWGAQADLRAAQAKALELQLSVVADYMAALSALAADSAVSFSGDIDTLRESLNNTGKLEKSTIDASAGLLTTVANAAANLWRQQQIGLLIEGANAPLQQILRTELRSIVNQDFRRDLEIESAFLERYFEDLLRTGGGSATANASLQEWFVVRRVENQRRQAAVDSYLKVLDNISDGHQKLFDQRDNLAARQLAQDLFALAKEMRDNVKEILKS